MFVTCMLAAVMFAGSAAFACTVWIGQIRITGSGANGTTADAFGANNGTFGMVYCNNVQPTPADVDISYLPNAPNAVAPITVEVFRKSCSAANAGNASFSGWWPDGTYTVNYLPNAAYDCMNPRGIPVGTMSVAGSSSIADGTKQGSTIVNVPVAGNDSGGVGGYVPGPSDKAAICVAKANSAYSNQAPIMFV